MAMTASPPPQLPSAANDAYIDQLDDDIARVRAEIAKLSKRKSLLTASLLSSSKVQSALQSQGITGQSDNNHPTESTPLTLADKQSQHNLVNVHRLAFGITSFPFTDPSPETSNVPLLGIRFDIPSHNGKFDEAPYYVFCKKLQAVSNARNHTATEASSYILTVHHHTIPSLVPLQDLVNRFLPQPTGQLGTGETADDDEGYDSPRSSGRDSSPAAATSGVEQTAGPKQNVHAFATEIYMYLSAHANRKAAISLLTENLHPSLSSMSSTGEDCRFIRLIWHDGLVGRLKVDEDGVIERAVVFGDEGRMKDLERLLSQGEGGESVSLMSLKARLDAIARQRGHAMDLGED